jgi:hypothetical protein
VLQAGVTCRLPTLESVPTEHESSSVKTEIQHAQEPKEETSALLSSPDSYSQGESSSSLGKTAGKSAASASKLIKRDKFGERVTTRYAGTLLLQSTASAERTDASHTTANALLKAADSISVLQLARLQS